ncbi:MAG: T9SS type A sorting domain-containing protein [Bacteroidales bacterium]
MKKLLVFYLLFSAWTNLFSQEWFQVGSTWYFDDPELIEFPAYGYTIHIIKKDTLINNLDSKLIQSTRYNYYNQLISTSYRVVREQENKVYYWDGDDFCLIYDFSLSIGDTLAIEVGSLCKSNSPIVIDSITELIVDDKRLNVQHISFSFESDGTIYFYQDSLIERIGSIKTFLYKPLCQLEVFGASVLRCYLDSDVYYRLKWFDLRFPGAPCDTAIYDPTYVSQELDDQSIKVFPNPFFSKVHIKNLNTDIKSIKIFNQYGQQVKHNEPRCMEVELDLSDLAAGCYFCLIETATSFTFHKLLKIDQR